MGLTTALAIAGTAAGLYSSSQQTRAANNAAMGQNRATDQSIELQREATDRAISTLSPYSQRGNRANAFMDAFLYGDGSYGAAPASSASGPAGTNSLEAILRQQNPGLAAAWDKWEANLKPGSYTKGHRAQYGSFEGYVQKVNPAAIDAAKTAMQQKTEAAKAAETKVTRGTAQKAYDQSPWAREAKDYETAIFGEDGVTSFENSPWKGMTERATTRANDEFMNYAGADGSALSGRTARGLQENAANIEDAFFDDYSGAVAGVSNRNSGAFTNFWNALGGQASTGYSADTGIASAGQNFAQTAGNALVDQAQVSGQAGMNAADSAADALNNGLSWAGWLYGKKNPVGGTSGGNNRVVDPSSIRVLPR